MDEPEHSDSSVEYLRSSDQQIFRTAGYPPHPSSGTTFKNKIKDKDSESEGVRGFQDDRESGIALFKRNSYRDAKQSSSDKKASEAMEKLERTSSKHKHEQALIRL